MEKIIQIADINGYPTVLTNKGRVFMLGKNKSMIWEEIPLPPLHTDEIDHEIPEHSCTQCVEVNAQNILTTPN